MSNQALAQGVSRIETLEYRGKNYEVPIFDAIDPVIIEPRANGSQVMVPTNEPVVVSLDSIWDLGAFREVHKPISLGSLDAQELVEFTSPHATRILDMPIKFPDRSEYRLPRALRQFRGAIQRIVDFEHKVHARHGEYYAYLTIDQRWVEPGTLHREAPCHVDGFQGARWNPKCLTNHTYTVSDVLPTAYYLQPFDFTGLDERVHDYFWEMNAQVADTSEAHRWQPREAELTMMDCYSVHRGVETDSRVFRTWLRLSFEERRRMFDRLGNAHNPLFDYAWNMVERDIEQLHLKAFREDCDPSLRSFPWQDLDGKRLAVGMPKSKPKLRR